jgi:hypothetical protein
VTTVRNNFSFGYWAFSDRNRRYSAVLYRLPNFFGVSQTIGLGRRTVAMETFNTFATGSGAKAVAGASPVVPANGTYRFRAVDGRQITVTVARAKVPARLTGLQPIAMATAMVLVVVASAMAALLVVLA